jgi:hypothetical protein
MCLQTCANSNGYKIVKGGRAMTATLDKPKDQRLIHSGIDWQQFKLIEQGFSDSPGIRLFYFKCEV